MLESKIRDLGDGLVLRRATPSDTEALVAFNSEVHQDPGVSGPEEYVGTWARDLMARPHPTFDASDFTIVEDTRTGAIVSTLNLIPQVWSYGRVPIGVGRIELVGTHPEYRKRGLIRAQMDVVHRWSAERGHQLQAITGIAYFYRQFGYEMALEHNTGRVGYRADVPKLKAGASEPYRVRPATGADVSFLAELSDLATRRVLVTCVRDESLWRYEVDGRSPRSAARLELRVIESLDGEAVGFLGYSPIIYDEQLALEVFELKPGASWATVTPVVARHLLAAGDEHAARENKAPPGSYAFALGAEHPCFEVTSRFLTRPGRGYAFYTRIADLVGFIRTIAPVLERRLAESVAPRYTGELKLSFYRSGVRLAFDRGQLAGVEAWQPTRPDRGDACFPDLTFLQVLLGFRALEDLERAFPDCLVASDGARALVKALFPKQVSAVWAVE
jgi:GNAT superfamily N-acetyltransferase